MPTDHNHNSESDKDKPQIIKIVKIPKIRISDDGTANAIAKRANSISIVSTVVNIILMVCTVILAAYAIVQANSSRSAATIAQNTLDETKKFNKEVFRRQDSLNKAQKQSDNERKVKDDSVFNAQKEFYATQKMGVDSQIAALRETKKEFEIENRPLLQIVDLKMDTLAVGKRLKIAFSLINYGRQPVKVIKSEIRIGFSYKKYNNGKIIYPAPTPLQHIDNTYITGGMRNWYTWGAGKPLPEDVFMNIVNGECSLYINGTVEFQNSITLVLSEYQYTYQITYLEGFQNVQGVLDTTISISKSQKKKI